MKMRIDRIKDLCVSISDGDHLAPPKAGEGIPFITISDIDEYNQVDFSDCMYVPKSYFDKIDIKRRPQKSDILYTVVGSFGIPVLISDDKNFCFQRHIAILKPDKNVVDGKYLYYLMKSRYFYALADAYAVGAAQRTISLTSLRRMKVETLDVDKQPRVGEVLHSYDKLIIKNREVIKLLECIIETVFKHLCSGKNATEIVRLRDIGFDFDRGLSYSSDEIDCDDGIDLINLKNIKSFGGFRFDGTKHFNGRYKPNQVVSNGDLVMGVTDMTQDRRTVGSVALIPRLHNKSVISADLIKVKSDLDNVFVYSMFRYGNISRHVAQFANGANVLHLKPKSILKVKISLPEDKSIKRFVKIAKPLISQIDILNEQNAVLSHQRDMLLPRLMTGKMEVKV